MCMQPVSRRVVLQVEEENAAARALYLSQGYADLRRDEEGRALRVRPPGVGSAASGLLLVASDELLCEEQCTLITMGKGLA